MTIHQLVEIRDGTTVQRGIVIQIIGSFVTVKLESGAIKTFVATALRRLGGKQ